MNAKILIVTSCLVASAALLFGMALLGGSQELTVGQIVRAEWPPSSVPAERVAETQVAVVGYCSKVERSVGPRWLEIVEKPPGEAGFEQPALRVEIEPGASMPDEVRLRAWTRVRGTYDPATQIFHANRVEMKCPSSEEERGEASPEQDTHRIFEHDDYDDSGEYDGDSRSDANAEDSNNAADYGDGYDYGDDE